MTHSLRNSFAVALTAAALLTTASAHAGTVVSNLGESQDLVPFFSGNVWRATSFTTDAQAYTLDSITVRVAPLMDPGALVAPRLYLDGDGLPVGSALETFAGQTVNSSGEYTFTSTGLSLNPNTTYWLALQGSDPDQTVWLASNSTAQTGSWTIGDGMIQSVDTGSSWPGSAGFVGQFSIDATPVPEPAPLGLLSLLGLAILGRRRGRKPSVG